MVATSALNGSAAGALQLLPRNATGRDAPVARVAYAANRAVLWQDECLGAVCPSVLPVKQGAMGLVNYCELVGKWPYILLVGFWGLDLGR